MDWSGVDYLWIIVMFLSAVWTLILTAPIHCRGSIGEQVMQCYISQIWWRNKLILDGLRVSKCSANVIFGWTVLLTHAVSPCSCPSSSVCCEFSSLLRGSTRTVMGILEAVLWTPAGQTLCVCMCFFTLDFWAKARPHTIHWKGFSPVWLWQSFRCHVYVLVHVCAWVFTFFILYQNNLLFKF